MTKGSWLQEKCDISWLCQTIPHFHTSEKCRTNWRMTKGSWLGKKCHIILTLSDYSALLLFWEVWNLVKNDKSSWPGKKSQCHIILTLSDFSTLLQIWEVWNLGWERKVGILWPALDICALCRLGYRNTSAVYHLKCHGRFLSFFWRIHGFFPW